MQPESLSRRDLLAAASSAGVTALAGCSVCASSLPTYDDYLRIAVPRIDQVNSGFRGRIVVVHRGEENWEWDFNRDNFFATYKDVKIRMYASSGQEISTFSLGELEPGTTTEREFEVNEFPLTVFASAEDVETDESVNEDCIDHRTGSYVAGYMGKIVEGMKQGANESDDDGNSGEGDRESSVSTSDNRSWELGTADGLEGGWRWAENILGGMRREYVNEEGQSWLVIDKRTLSGRDQFTSDFLLYQTKCFHRQIVGPNDQQQGRRDFSLVPDVQSWLPHDPAFSIQLYRNPGSYHRFQEYGITVSETHDFLRDLYESTDWEIGKLSATRTVSRETWIEVATALDSTIDLTNGPFLSCGPDYVRCQSNEFPTPIRCAGGHKRAFYRAPIAGETLRGVILKVSWEGLGPRPPRTTARNGTEDGTTTDR